MTGFEQQWISALVMMTAALFVSAGLPVAPQWRRRLKFSAIGLFILVLIVVMVEIARWAIDRGW